MRVDVFFFLIISFEISSSARNKSMTNSTASGSHFCDRDRGEILFKAQAVILARVRRKKVLFFTAYNTRSSPWQQRIGRMRSWSKLLRWPPPMSTPMSSPLLPPPPWLSIPLVNIELGVEGKRTRVDSSEGATFIEVWTNCMSSSKEGKEVCLFLGPSTSRGCTQWWINWENFKWRSLETLRASHVPFLQVLGCSTLQELVYRTTKRHICFVIKHFDQAGLTLIQIYLTTNKQTQI